MAVGLWIIKRLERLLIRNSDLPDQPWFEPQRFDWAGHLERNWTEIVAELSEIMGSEEIPNFQDISKDQESVTRDDGWKTFFLYIYGYRVNRSCNICPRTAELVESIPGMYTAFFSILAPGKQVRRHRGPYKGVLRCHLALIVPEDAENCWIDVDGTVRHWTRGRCLVFDDTYRHQVQNNTDEPRVVLFLDIKRPMNRFGAILNNTILGLMRISPFIRDAVRNQKAWDARLEKDRPGTPAS